MNNPGIEPMSSQWSQAQLENIWGQLQHQMHPFVYVLCLDGDLYRVLDEEAKRFVAQKFMSHVLENVIYCRDGTGFDRYFLGAPRHFAAGRGMIIRIIGSEPLWIMRSDVGSTEPMVSQATLGPLPFPAKSTKIPRPPNAYILYRKDRHTMVKAANPGITNNEISQILGRAWNMESREIRQKYKDLSERIKEALMRKHPDYQYKPRRPNEKKKRARKTQGDAEESVADGEAAMSSPESNG